MVGPTKVAAVVLGQFGIRVNCLSPYRLATPLGIRYLGLNDEQLENWMSLHANLKGLNMRAEDIANVALYLARDEVEYVSGHNLLIDEGYTIVNPLFGMFQYPDSCRLFE